MLVYFVLGGFHFHLKTMGDDHGLTRVVSFITGDDTVGSCPDRCPASAVALSQYLSTHEPNVHLV